MKYNPRVIIIIGIFIVAFSLLSLTYVQWRYRAVLAFDPAKYTNEYLKFLGNLISLLLGFLLVNVYWENRLKSSRARSLRSMLRFHLDHISKITNFHLKNIDHFCCYLFSLSSQIVSVVNISSNLASLILVRYRQSGLRTYLIISLLIWRMAALLAVTTDIVPEVAW